MKVAVAKSLPPALPVTVIVYVPGCDPMATVNPAGPTFPPLILQVLLDEIMLVGLLAIVQEVSAGLNPAPVIVTPVSVGPDVGKSVIVGAALTFWMNAVSAETKIAIAKTSSVTA